MVGTYRLKEKCSWCKNDNTLNFMKGKENVQKYFFSLQKEAILKWLDTVESIMYQIDDIYIDRYLDVKEIQKDTCEGEYRSNVLGDFCWVYFSL